MYLFYYLVVQQVIDYWYFYILTIPDMKKIIFFIPLVISVAVFGQKNNIGLNRGQVVTITSKTSQDMNMGPGMDMKNTSVLINNLVVSGEDAKNFTVTSTLKKVTLSSQMMGQETKYDSDNPADKDSEIGKTMSDKIGKESIVYINKLTGEVVADKKNGEVKDSSDKNPFAAMLQSGELTDGAALATDLIFLIPAGKKAGDSWLDSTINKDLKSKRTYTLKSIKDDIATIGLVGQLTGTSTMEMQGMQFDISMNSTTTGEITVNTKTKLVQKRTADADIDANIDVMGQNSPITAKALVTTEYKY